MTENKHLNHIHFICFFFFPFWHEKWCDYEEGNFDEITIYLNDDGYLSEFNCQTTNVFLRFINGIGISIIPLLNLARAILSSCDPRDRPDYAVMVGIFVLSLFLITLFSRLMCCCNMKEENLKTKETKEVKGKLKWLGSVQPANGKWYIVKNQYEYLIDFVANLSRLNI